MRYAIVKNGKVVNVAAADAEFAAAQGWVACGPETQIGDLWDGETFTRPAPDPVARSAELFASVQESTQRRLDEFAQTRNYAGVLSLCTYATSPNPKFAAEGQYGVQARDATWSKLYEILAEVQAGARPMPSSYEDVESELPALIWPQ